MGRESSHAHRDQRPFGGRHRSHGRQELVRPGPIDDPQQGRPAGGELERPLAAILVPDKFFGPPLLAAFAWPALAIAAGDAVRSRRANLAAAEERARRTEQTRESETRRRVVEERLRIARELHDVVAHRMAVINVQAGVAAHLLRDQPDAAEAALGVVRGSAATVLDELGSLLNVLRTADDAEAPVEPAPTLDELPALVATFETAGLDVHWDSSGHRRPMSESVQLAAYRLVQEGLTNAHKHGDGRARLVTTYGDDGFTLAIENAMSATNPDGDIATGFGLVGMRERVSAAGGSLTTGSENGAFRICATLPTMKEPA